MKISDILRQTRHFLFYPRFHFSRFQFNLVALLFICIGIVAGSYFTLSNIFPRIFALNDTTYQWTLSTATAGDYTVSEVGGIATVAVEGTEETPVGAHPTGGQVGANELLNPDLSGGSEGGDADNWSVSSVPPSGWVEVPSNPDFYGGDYDGNFLVMQYEAKAWDTQTSTVVADGGYAAGANWAGNNTQTRYEARSMVGGRPWVYIAQNHGTYFDANEACSAVDMGTTSAHLINNNEWMTIARNAVYIDGNWTNGDVGSGALFRGNSNSSASMDGSNPLSGINTRTLVLSNGSIVWDLAGNVWDWTNDIQQTAINTTAEWVEWNHANVAPGAIDLYGPPDGYLSAQGMGQIYGGALNNAFLRGGAWGNATTAGAFAPSLNLSPARTNNNFGFRCASDPVDISQSFSSSSGRQASGGTEITIGSVANGKIIQSANVGDTAVYDFSVYIYNMSTDPVGGLVDENVAELYYNGDILTTDYDAVGDGWYKLSGTLTGANESREYGVQVKTGKTVIVDDFTLIKSGIYSVYTNDGYFNAQVNTWDNLCEGTLSGSACTVDATHQGASAIKYQICTADLGGASGEGQGTACETGNEWQYWDGSAWISAGTGDGNTGDELMDPDSPVMQQLSSVSHKISVKAVFTTESADVPYLPHISLGLTTDTNPPNVEDGGYNAHDIIMTRSNGGTSVAENGWTKGESPYFTWQDGADNPDESGVKGYCLSLSLDTNEDGIPDSDPETSKGLLGTSPVPITGTTCGFIVEDPEIDFATDSYKGDSWLESSNKPYILAIKVIDNAGNVFDGDSAIFQFRFDNIPPTNVAYINCASGSFSNVADMNFSWPTGEVSPPASDDENAGILGWQYQINATENDGWLGTTIEDLLGIGAYIGTGVSSRTLTTEQDCPDSENCSIAIGSNIVYFRSVDAAGNTSSEGTIRTCNLLYGGSAPTFETLDTVTVTPATATSNSYALSWPEATPTDGQSVAHYYYMVNTLPPSTLATLEGNTATYIDNETSRNAGTKALPNVNKGSNTVYVVAVDDADTPNYSPSNYITGTFTLNSTDPDNVGNLVATDSSIKSQSLWNVTLTWTEPVYKGAGNLTYQVYRSTDGVNFTLVGSSTGLSYVDNTPESRQYFYKVYTKDGADAQSTGTNAVTITPTGRWTTPPVLDSGPSVENVTTKRASVVWSTNRTCDSKVQYSTDSGKYLEVEPSNSTHTVSHAIQLSGLAPNTVYYYRSKWTDEDGNTAVSEEKSFTTAPAPSVKDVVTKNIGLNSAIVQFTSQNASGAKIYFGTTTGFGGMKEVFTSTVESTYTVELTALEDGTKYYYRINTVDEEGDEYEGTILDFTTMPRPKITDVELQEVKNTAQPSIDVYWQSNTDVSSIVRFYPINEVENAYEQVDLELISGEHSMRVVGLKPETTYGLIVRGNDVQGNEAISDTHTFTTSTDTRPPEIKGATAKGGIVSSEIQSNRDQSAQLIVSWQTDEPATSQVFYGEGATTTYSQKTQKIDDFVYDHIVVINNLRPSSVYHIKVESVDDAGNTGTSDKIITVTPKTTNSVIEMIFGSLADIFSFL